MGIFNATLCPSTLRPEPSLGPGRLDCLNWNWRFCDFRPRVHTRPPPQGRLFVPSGHEKRIRIGMIRYLGGVGSARILRLVLRWRSLGVFDMLYSSKDAVHPCPAAYVYEAEAFRVVSATLRKRLLLAPWLPSHPGNRLHYLPGGRASRGWY